MADDHIVFNFIADNERKIDCFISGRNAAQVTKMGAFHACFYDNAIAFCSHFICNYIIVGKGRFKSFYMADQCFIGYILFQEFPGFGSSANCVQVVNDKLFVFLCCSIK